MHEEEISIHALLAESDKVPQILGLASGISIHALLAESDGAVAGGIASFFDFYPRSPCGERLFGVAVLQHVVVISIHALLAESDRMDVLTTFPG